MNEVPEKYLKYQSDKVSTSMERLREMTKKAFDNLTSGMKIIKNNYDIDHSVVQRMKEVYGVLGDDVLCGIYTLDGSEALVYRPSKVKFEYVSIV